MEKSFHQHPLFFKQCLSYTLKKRLLYATKALRKALVILGFCLLNLQLLKGLPGPEKYSKKKWFQASYQTNYAAILNLTFILLRTNPPSEAFEKICGKDGLCHKQNICGSPALLAFYWLLCKEHMPGFLKLPCVKENASSLRFDPVSGIFQGNEALHALAYLNLHMKKNHIPSYMNYMLAKIVTGSPENYLHKVETLYGQSCARYPKLCEAKRPPALAEKSGH